MKAQPCVISKQALRDDRLCSPEGSGMSLEVHVPFYERLGVQFPRPTHRFCLSCRDVEDLLAQRGVTVSYETIRHWCQTALLHES